MHRVVPGKRYAPRPAGFDGAPTSYKPRAPWLDMSGAGQTQLYCNQIVPAQPAPVFLPPIGSSAIVVQFKVPRGRMWVNQQITNQVVTGGWLSGTGSVLWEVDIDGLPVPGLSAIPLPLADIGNIFNRPFRAHENRIVQLICNNISLVTAPGVNPLIGALAGYFDAMQQGQEAVYL